MSIIPQHIPIGQKVDVGSSGCIDQPGMRNLGIVDTREKLVACTRTGLLAPGWAPVLPKPKGE